jgi:hypothetical protein
MADSHVADSLNNKKPQKQDKILHFLIILSSRLEDWEAVTHTI